MVSPKLLLLYTKTWKLIMQKGGPTGQDMVKFGQALPVLRNALTCSVCGELLTGCELYSSSPSIQSTTCDHFACKDCRGKDREESKFCELCGDWSQYREDDMLTFLLKGYKEFCRHFLRDRKCTHVLEIKYAEDPDFDAGYLLQVIQEGSRQYEPEMDDIEDELYQSDEDKEEILPVSSDEVRSSDETIVELEVMIEKEEPVDIKTEPEEQDNYHQFYQERHEVIDHSNVENDQDSEIAIDHSSEMEEEQSISFSIPDPLASSTTTIAHQEEMEEDEEELEEDEEEENEESQSEEQEEFQEVKLEEIRTSSLRLSTPPPPPLPVLTQTFQSASPSPSTITFQRAPGQTITSTQPIQINSRQLPSFVIAGPSQSTSGGQIHAFHGGSRFPMPIRLARLIDGRPLTMVRQVVGTPPSSTVGGVRHATVTLPLSASDLAKKKIIVRPATLQSAATAAQLQKWPDANKVLQYASGGTFLPHGQQVLHVRHKVPVSSAAGSIPVRSSPSTESRPQQVTRITLGSMSSDMSTGSSSSSSSGTLPNVSVRPTGPSTSVISQPKIIGTTVMRTEGDENGPIKKLKVRLPKPKTSPKLRRGCRCGNAATQPGKLTCCGQRCPCYVEAKSCTDCRCRGCRNPHLPGGKKLLQGINAVIDTKTNTTTPLSINISSAAGSSNNTIVSSVPMTASTSTMNLVPVSAAGTNSGHQIFTRIHHQGTSQSQGTTYSQLIPLANFAGFSFPISLISPATHTTGVSGGLTTMRSHNSESIIRIQNTQNVQRITGESLNPNVGSETYE